MNSATEKQVIAISKGLFTIQVRAIAGQNTEIELIHSRITALEGIIGFLVQMAANAQPVKNPDLTKVEEILEALKKEGLKIHRANAREAFRIDQMEAALQELIQPGEQSGKDAENQSGTAEE